MLNRTALIVRPKEPLIEWTRSIDDDGALPTDRTLAMFKTWFSIEYRPVMKDLCARPLEDDEKTQFSG